MSFLFNLILNSYFTDVLLNDLTNKMGCCRYDDVNRGIAGDKYVKRISMTSSSICGGAVNRWGLFFAVWHCYSSYVFNKLIS